MRLISVKENFSSQAEELYTQSFPPDERRNWQEILNNISNEDFDFYAITSEGTFCGIISLWSFKDFLYTEHFAIKPELRNSGLGSRVLSYIKQNINSSIVLEAEPPEDSLSKRRTEFYKRNGFYLLDNDYIQPPYSPEKESVEMKIMTTNPGLPFEEIKSTLYKRVYPNQ